MEKLSIIVPVRNEKKNIKNFITSILNCHPNLELLLGDDASTDGTKEIIHQFETDSRIKTVYFKHNIGAGAVRNQLLKLAQGDFIAIQDADDPPYLDRFQKQIQYLKMNPDVDVVGSWADLVTQEGVCWRTLKVRQQPTFLDWVFQRAIVHASVMFRHQIKSLATYNEVLRTGEDYYFLTALYLKGCKFENIQSTLYRYVIEPWDLRTRMRLRFREVFQAKLAISRLFLWHTRWMFIVVNFFILSVGFVRGAVLLVRNPNRRPDSGNNDGGFNG